MLVYILVGTSRGKFTASCSIICQPYEDIAGRLSMAKISWSLTFNSSPSFCRKDVYTSLRYIPCSCANIQPAYVIFRAIQGLDFNQSQAPARSPPKPQPLTSSLNAAQPHIRQLAVLPDGRCPLRPPVSLLLLCSL